MTLEGVYQDVGEITMFAGNFESQGYAFADGRLLPIAQYDNLFSQIGTTYGGDGQTTFALPDLRGRAPTAAMVQPTLAYPICVDASPLELDKARAWPIMF